MQATLTTVSGKVAEVALGDDAVLTITVAGQTGTVKALMAGDLPFKFKTPTGIIKGYRGQTDFGAVAFAVTPENKEKMNTLWAAKREKEGEVLHAKIKADEAAIPGLAEIRDLTHKAEKHKAAMDRWFARDDGPKPVAQATWADVDAARAKYPQAAAHIDQVGY
jgi:hypothetical protein